MPYDRDEARQRARKRLQEREQRRAASAANQGRSTAVRRNARGNNPERSERPQRAKMPRETRSASARSRTDASARKSWRPKNTDRRNARDNGRKSISKAGRGGQLGNLFADGLPNVNQVVSVDLFKSRRFQLIAAAILAALILIFAVSRCSSNPETSAQETANASGSTQTQAESKSSNETETLTPNKSELVSLLGDEDAEKLIKQAETDENALWIAAHPDKFALDGPEVQYKILKLAADDPASLLYVRDFVEKYPEDKASNDTSLAMSTASPSKDVPGTNTPHLYQWDRRWGQTVYCSTSFGLTGCGPTSLAMVYQGLIGKDDLSPYDFGQKAQEHGYMQQYDGTDAGFFTEVASEVGLSYQVLDPTVESIQSELSAGRVIITNLAPGYFTKYGHYFVLAGLDDKGQVIVNDPYSVVRSSKTWDPEQIASESRVFYSYSV